MPRSFSIKPKKRESAPVPSQDQITLLDAEADAAYRRLQAAKEALQRAEDDWTRARSRFHAALRGVHNSKST